MSLNIDAYRLTNTCSVLGSVQKICDVSGGDHILIQLGGLSRDVLKAVLSKIGQILQCETGGFLSNSHCLSADRNLPIIEEVVTRLVNSTVENERKELLDRRIQITTESYHQQMERFRDDLMLTKQILSIDESCEISANRKFTSPVIKHSENVKTSSNYRSEYQFNSIINRLSRNPDGIQAIIDLFSHISSSTLALDTLPDLNMGKMKNQSTRIQLGEHIENDETPENIRNRLRPNRDLRTSMPKKSVTRISIEKNSQKSKETSGNFDEQSSSSFSRTNLKDSTISQEMKAIISKLPAHDIFRTEDGVIFGYRLGKTQFVCSKCEWKTKSRALLVLHSSESHGIGKTYKCDDCGKVYTVPSKYNKHREDWCIKNNDSGVAPPRKRAKSCFSS